MAPSLTAVMAFRAVSAPMLRSEPGTLLETVAGTTTMGTQNSSYFPRAANSSSSDRKACGEGGEGRTHDFREGCNAARLGGGGGKEVLLAAQNRGEREKVEGCQGEEPGLSQRAAAKQTGTTPHSLPQKYIYTQSAVQRRHSSYRKIKASERLNGRA